MNVEIADSAGNELLASKIRMSIKNTIVEINFRIILTKNI